jgi:ATP-binding cassette subfamily B (MDR/TAP) protein 1
MPLFTIVFGQLFNIFVTQTPAQIRQSASIIAAIFVGLAVYNLVFGYLGSMLWGLVGEETGAYLRTHFFRSLLKQEVGYFETETSTGALTQMLADVDLVQSQTGGKMATVLQNAAQIVICLVVAFIYSWKLTLVLVAIAPLIAVAALIQGKLLASGAAKNAESYRRVSALALEVIAGLRVVASFVWEEEAERLLEQRMRATRRERLKGIHLMGVGSGFSFFCIFAVYSLGFWYGAQLVADTPANGGILVGDMLIVFFTVVSAAAAIGLLTAAIPDLARARVALFSLMSVINRTPLIDTDAESGIRDVTLRGEIEFDNVTFAFPSRPDQTVLKSLTLRIGEGNIVGVVGASGAGKSTLVALLERFHDAASGVIRIDGVPIQQYNLKWLRRQIGLVSQEPKLFDATIAENILVGRPDATMEEVVAAATAANAHSFISGLSDGYDTRVGEGGSQLSGGQKQRIAIARAVLKNPRIILLDEATSALDNESEAVVQEALDKLMQGRTTVVVAHRLSTIRNSDIIFVMQAGAVAEQGRHLQLLAENGLYYGLVVRQLDQSERAELKSSMRLIRNPTFSDL